MELDIMATIQQYATIPVAVVCFLLGAWLKTVKVFPDEFIPLALGVVGIVGVLWCNAWAITPENIIGGIFSAALAVYAHQSGKQITEAMNKKESDAEPGGDTDE